MNPDQEENERMEPTMCESNHEKRSDEAAMSVHVFQR